jgi:hypothetical protein
MPGISLRGRLVRPLLVEIAFLDQYRTSKSGGYDPVWKTPTVATLNPGTVGATRTDGLVYRAPVRLRAQLERGQTDVLNMQPSGNNPHSTMTLVFHAVELEKAGLMNYAEGESMFKVGDKLLAIYSTLGVLRSTIKDPPGLYVTQVAPDGEGQSGEQNLIVVTFEDRNRALPHP